jgi:hypothetical protein
MPDRHFPPPRSVDDNGACFIVRGNGQPLAYVYYDRPQAGDLTWDVARRIAANIAKLPDLVAANMGALGRVLIKRLTTYGVTFANLVFVGLLEALSKYSRQCRIDDMTKPKDQSGRGARAQHENRV